MSIDPKWADEVFADRHFAFAKLWLEGRRYDGYGHMRMSIHIPSSHNYHKNEWQIVAGCQIGDGSGSSSRTGEDAIYGREFGIGWSGSFEGHVLPLHQLQSATKELTAVNRKYQAAMDKYGSPSTFSDLCHRLLVITKAQHIVARSELWKGNFSDVVTVVDGGFAMLRRAEVTLLNEFTK